MIVEELIEALKKHDPSAEVRVKVSDPKQGASSTKSLMVKRIPCGEILLSAFVWSDDEQAWFGEVSNKNVRTLMDPK